MINLSTRTTSQLAGSFFYGQDYIDGVGSDARFYAPAGVAFTTDGSTVHVADSYNHRIRSIDIGSGEVRTLAGSGPSGQKAGFSRGGSP